MPIVGHSGACLPTRFREEDACSTAAGRESSVVGYRFGSVVPDHFRDIAKNRAIHAVIATVPVSGRAGAGRITAKLGATDARDLGNSGRHVNRKPLHRGGNAAAIAIGGARITRRRNDRLTLSIGLLRPASNSVRGCLAQALLAESEADTDDPRKIVVDRILQSVPDAGVRIVPDIYVDDARVFGDRS